MVKYPAKGLIVLDPSSIAIEEVTVGDGIACCAAERFRTGMVKIPNTHIEAMKSDFADYWLQAEKVQLDKIAASNTMVLVPYPPKGTSILPGKWVYDLKSDSDGYVLEFRARWVVCGNR